MSVFTYVAKDEKGALVTGTYNEVNSVSELRGELDKMGYALVKARKGKKEGKARFGRVRQTDVATFAYKFAGMYSAGLPILRCLETLEQQTDSPGFQNIVTDIRECVAGGSSLRDAFGRHRGVFSDFFLGMIEAGEVGGKLGETLQMSAVYLEKQVQLRQKLVSAFLYPVFVTVMCFAVITFLLIYVIPVFTKLYDQVHATLPGPTLALMVASRFIRNSWPVIVIGGVATVFGMRKVFANPQFRAKWDEFKLNMPVFGKLNRMLVSLHFTRTLAMLLSVGVSVIKSLEMAGIVAHNMTVDAITTELKKAIQSGAQIAVSMKKYDIFPPVIIQMASSGEEVGMLPEMLTKGAELLDRDVERTIHSLLVKLEPTLTLVMGLIVGFILIGAYLPMFDYMGHLK